MGLTPRPRYGRHIFNDTSDVQAQEKLMPHFWEFDPASDELATDFAQTIMQAPIMETTKSVVVGGGVTGRARVPY